MIDSLFITLHSFTNNYQSLMQELRHDTLNNEQLSLIVNLSANTVRNRRTKPELWKLTDISCLADYFNAPSKPSVQLVRLLSELPVFLKKLSVGERRQFERLLTLRMNQIEGFNRNDWPTYYLLRMYRNLLASPFSSLYLTD